MNCGGLLPVCFFLEMWFARMNQKNYTKLLLVFATCYKRDYPHIMWEKKDGCGSPHKRFLFWGGSLGHTGWLVDSLSQKGDIEGILVFNVSPEDQEFDQEVMQKHLYQCVLDNKVTMLISC